MNLQYFNILIFIHEQVFDNYSYGVRSDFNRFNEMELLIEHLFCQENILFDKLLDEVIWVAALIVLYQPFYDGNHRIALGFIQFVLDKYGYLVLFDKIWDNYLNGEAFIPIIYDKDEKSSISIYRKRLLKNIQKKI